jgi:hypothetical protein
MNWFESHVYLAAWLGILVPFVILYFQIRATSRRKQHAVIEWPKVLLSFVAVVTLAIRLTPGTEPSVQWFAGSAFYFAVVALLVGGFTARR